MVTFFQEYELRMKLSLFSE